MNFNNLRDELSQNSNNISNCNLHKKKMSIIHYIHTSFVLYNFKG